jgi:hypothetical protein
MCGAAYSFAGLATGGAGPGGSRGSAVGLHGFLCATAGVGGVSTQGLRGGDQFLSDGEQFAHASRISGHDRPTSPGGSDYSRPSRR